ncbi:MAG TPA: M13-type metalloendopeptidase [Terriglobales bacterium]|nr:M13-type metalloendopeptidase [Terriglobales bacterium]
MLHSGESRFEDCSLRERPFRSVCQWRVNGVVSNMPSFAKAYGCKRGDKMVNARPCRVW